MKKTLVLGASPNPDRYSYKAVQMLTRYGHEVVAVGRRKGVIAASPIQSEFPDAGEVDTVTLYLNPQNQRPYYDAILALQPKRIIFNPGTENPELIHLAVQHGIAVEEGCTLVMLSIGVY